MAATSEGSRLTALQRRLQLALRALTLQDVIAVWRLLDPVALDESWPGVETALLRIVQARRAQSALLAARYIAAFRAAELGTADTPPIPPVPADDDAVRVSLAVTGRETIRRLAPIPDQAPPGVVEQASRTALTRVAGAVSRHVLDGGRETVLGAVAADRQALGWARVAGGGACAFCRMLASRGPAYRTQRTAGFQAHDHCACGIEPVYRRDAAWPPNSERFRREWDEVTAGLSGRAALNAYRRSLAAEGSE